MLLNRWVELEKLTADQLWEEHEVYLHVFKQCKDTVAKAKAVQDRLLMLRKRKIEERKQGMTTNQITWEASNALNSTRNQLTANAINQWNDTSSSLNNITT
jgi:hypothetical protein